MKRIVAMAIVFSLLAISCGGSDDAGDLVAGDIPEAVSLNDPNDPNAPLQVGFGGFFFSDGTVSQLCSALAESVPPQCASVVIDIEAPDLDVILGHVADSFGNPEDAKVNVDQGIYWTDDWINLTGALQANRLVLE